MFIMTDDQSSIETTHFPTKVVNYKTLVVINCMRIPKEMINIIKSYCFYDKKSILMAKIEKFIKFKKKRIVMMLRDFTISRFMPGFPEDIILYGEGEFWTIINFTNRRIEFTLEATNCKCCGNYKNTSRNFTSLPKIIKCLCVK